MANTTLPQKQTPDQMSTKWAAILNPVLQNPLNQASILKNISLSAGANIVPHMLGAALQGWYIIRQRAPSQIYDTQDSNPTPAITLTLQASTPVVVDLAVF
jgi:hypothetical protein